MWNFMMVNELCTDSARRRIVPFQQCILHHPIMMDHLLVLIIGTFSLWKWIMIGRFQSEIERCFL